MASQRYHQHNNDSPSTNIEILHLDTGLFTIQDIPGKGKGLIASQTIAPGTCILSESPLFTTENIRSIETTERDLAKEVQALPKDLNLAFFALHNNYPSEGSPISNIVRSNAYPLGPTSGIGAIFLAIARINHSCRPNAQQAWNPATKKETVYALRSIQIGEEITLSYHNGGTSSQRRADLKEHFRFDCTCDACSLPAEELAASDARLRKAAELDEQIGDSKRVHLTPELALADCKTLLGIYQEEGIADTRLPRLYYDAFQICVLHSDQARAKTFANRYRALKVLAEGPDSLDAREIMPFARKPATHESFGATKKWAASLKQIPKDTDPESFERWLWRE
ncbi:putative set-containing protein 5 protein [Coleophoma cylindrospora]|uniref:Putative set-containing protein 5 protein n=1 Tax=Coleophoma cylindrospora TaxID=1849047 RepID=A0A3D8S9K0_9HELO|nr:putative set-containing protein 5 protein [Coleophoma cylindrospora]